MRVNYRQALLTGALLALVGSVTASGTEDQPDAAPVGVVKATVFLGEFE